MKKFLSNNNGISLIELIVASLLITVVIGGIFSINMVLNNNNQEYGQLYLVKSATQATLNHMLNNASQSVGNAAQNAVLIGNSNQIGTNTATDKDTFCIHQPSTITANDGSNLINAAQDIWLCYEWSPATYQINWCAEPYNGGATSCTTAIANGTALNGNKETFLGTTAVVPTVQFTPNGNPLQVVITLQNCLDNTNCPGNPETNPEVNLAGSVIPAQASAS